MIIGKGRIVSVSAVRACIDALTLRRRVLYTIDGGPAGRFACTSEQVVATAVAIAENRG